MWKRKIVTYAPLNAAGIEQVPSNLGATLHHSANAYAIGRSSLFGGKCPPPTRSGLPLHDSVFCTPLANSEKGGTAVSSQAWRQAFNIWTLPISVGGLDKVR